MAYNPNYNKEKKTNAFDADTDYSALIENAVANNDMAAAAKYEQQRNEKIDALGLDYEKTDNYSQYYQKPEGYDPDTDYSALMGDAAANKDYMSAAGYEQQRNDKIDGEGLDYSKTNKYTPYAQSQKSADGFYEQYMNREPFRYDLTQDPLYQQYKEQFMSQGKMAMQDTMAQAAAMTGGYGNSYAQTAGQQMYNQYLGKMNDIVPELYDAAYRRYQNEGSDIYNRYQMSQNRADSELARIEAGAKDAYDTAITLISNGIMPDKSMLNEAGIPWEMALNYWKIANGEDYVVPGMEQKASGYSYYKPVDTPDGGGDLTHLAELAKDYSLENPGGSVESRTVSNWINGLIQSGEISASDSELLKKYLVNEGYATRP